MTNEPLKIKILHVDDKQDTLSVVKTILEKEGYEVTSVLSGLEAMKQIDANGFSLVILDIMMPDMSGWDIFTRISKTKPNYKTIFLSVIDISEEKKEEIKNAGVCDYFKKPFDRDDFVARVKKILAE